VLSYETEEDQALDAPKDAYRHQCFNLALDHAIQPIE